MKRVLTGWPMSPYGLAFVFFLAFVLRLAVYFQSQSSPQVETPVLDSRYYLDAGQALASGKGLGDSPYFMSQGYILFSALLHWLFENARQAIVLFQILVDSASCVLAAFLAFRLFGSTAGMTAGILLALNGYQMLSATRILPETTAAFLLAALAFLFVRPQPLGGVRLFFSGTLLGLLTLFRSNALLMLPFLGLVIWLAGKLGRKDFVKRFSFFLLGTAGVILPVTLRNLLVGKDLVLISSSGGVNFYLGNVPEGDGRFISLNQLPLAPGGFDDDPTGGRFEKSIQAYAESREGRALKPSEVSSFWMDLAFKEIAGAPFAWLKLLLRKLFLFFNAFEIPQVDNLYFLSRYIPLLDSPLAHLSRLLWSLTLFGFILLLFSARRPAALLLIFLAYALSVILFFVTARHRLPILPVSACLAGLAVHYLFGLFRNWNARRLMPGIALLLACITFTNLNPASGQRFSGAASPQKASWFRVSDEYLDFASQHNNMAALLLERGDAVGAEREARRGLALKPQHSTLLFNLARALEAQGKFAQAKTAAERSLQNSPNNSKVASFLGGLCYKTGDFAGTRAALEDAVRLSPSNAEVWNMLGPTLYKLGDSEGALAALGRAEALAPGWFQPSYNRGVLLSRLNRSREAAALLDSLHQADPDHRAVALALAEALVEANRFAEAEQLLNGWLGKTPEDVGALLLKAELLLKQSRPKEARALLLQVLTANPKNSRALELLQTCSRMEKGVAH